MCHGFRLTNQDDYSGCWVEVKIVSSHKSNHLKLVQIREKLFSTEQETNKINSGLNPYFSKHLKFRTFLFDAKKEIWFVLLGKCRKIDSCSGQVTTFLRSQSSPVFNLTNNVVMAYKIKYVKNVYKRFNLKKVFFQKFKIILLHCFTNYYYSNTNT